MNGLTQDTASKILALNPITELAVLQIIDAALGEAAKPHADEAETCKLIVNETNARASAKEQALTDALSAKQNEIIGLRLELGDAQAKLISTVDELARAQQPKSDPSA